MKLFFRLRCMAAFARHVPWVDPVGWKKDDAISLQTFLKTEAGVKLKDYLTNFVLRQQADACISTTNLKYKAGSSVGSKAILTHLGELAEAENFTDEDGSD